MSSYKKSGVDTSKADEWVSRVATLVGESSGALQKRVVSGVGDYAAIYALSDDQWVAASTDGVGTKLLWTQAGLGEPEDLAMDLLAMNANDLLCVGATPTLFLDYLAIGSPELLNQGQSVERFIKGLAKHCAQSQQLLVGGETAQMPDLYEANGYDVAGFSIGFLKPTERLGVSRIQPGAQVWGWSSSGPHSNGYSWLRKVFSKASDAVVIRSLFMQPTKLYVNEFRNLKAALSRMGAESGIQAAFHITGSGLLNLLRAQPEGRTIGFDLRNWPQVDPKWVKVFKERSAASDDELFTTFNMGYGFLVVFDRMLGEKQKSLLDSQGLHFLGEVIEEPKVHVRGLTLT